MDSRSILRFYLWLLPLLPSFRARGSALKEGKTADTAWPYPQPPWYFNTEGWAFIGTRSINGTHPPDWVPDPSITYTSQPNPSALGVFRYTDTPWGPWDEVTFEHASAKVGNGPAHGRVTQAYSTVVPPTLPTYPLHKPFRLARFEWTHRSDGATDLHVYSPPNNTVPVFSIWGLSRIPFISFPIDYGFFPRVGVDDKFVQSVVDSYDPVGPVKGHVVGEAAYNGTGGIGLYTRFETSDELNLDGGFYNVGFYVDAKVRWTVGPYPS